MMRERIRWAGPVALALAVLVTSACRKELSFSLTFRDANGLRPGQFLVYHGVRAGEVVDVALDPGGRVRVGVRVFPEFREAVYREAAYSIEKPGGALDISGERQIAMTDRPGNRTPIRQGAIVEGQDSPLGGLLDRAAAVARDAWAAAAQAARKMADEFSRTPAGRDLSRAMKDFSQKAAGTAEQAAAGLEEVRRQAEAYRDRLVREGKQAQAAEFWKGFESWYDQVRSAEHTEGPPQTPEPSGRPR